MIRSVCWGLCVSSSCGWTRPTGSWCVSVDRGRRPAHHVLVLAMPSTFQLLGFLTRGQASGHKVQDVRCPERVGPGPQHELPLRWPVGTDAAARCGCPED